MIHPRCEHFRDFFFHIWKCVRLYNGGAHGTAAHNLNSQRKIMYTWLCYGFSCFEFLILSWKAENGVSTNQYAWWMKILFSKPFQSHAVNCDKKEVSRLTLEKGKGQRSKRIIKIKVIIIYFFKSIRHLFSVMETTMVEDFWQFGPERSRLCWQFHWTHTRTVPQDIFVIVYKLSFFLFLSFLSFTPNDITFSCSICIDALAWFHMRLLIPANFFSTRESVDWMVGGT